MTLFASPPKRQQEKAQVPNSIRILGCLCVFGSAFCFYLATIVIRLSQARVTIDPAFFVFARFLLGFVVVAVSMVLMRTRLKPVRYHLLFGRTIANCIAVFCFFKAVSVTTVAEANILNMTYPLFIAVFSWFFFREQRDVPAMVLVVVAFIGVWLVLSPAEMGMNKNNFWGLASGITASAAIIYLNISRRFHDTQTILFFMFGPGTAVIFLIFHKQFFIPDRTEMLYLFLCAVAGIGGQYLLTLGFRYVTAVEGGIISSTRILLAALMGSFLVGEAPLEISGWIGALLIFGANIYLTVRKAAVPKVNN